MDDHTIITSARRPKSDTLSGKVTDKAKQHPIWAALISIAIALTPAVTAQCSAWAAQQQAAAAAAQASVTQASQAKGDVELDATYTAIRDKVQVLSEVSAELARSGQEQAQRIEMLEGVVKAGLSGTAAGRRFQPAPETAAPDVQLEEVQTPLPASPAAAAATTRRNP